MNKHVHPEFFKAFDHYKAMLVQYGECNRVESNQKNY